MKKGNSERCFLLGVGAQKSGTTWLNRLVMSDPSGFTPTFEYHVWDGLYGLETTRWKAPKPSLGRRLHSWTEDIRRGYGSKSVLRWQFQQEPDRYFKHFSKILARPGLRLAADITPGYSGLPREAFEQIKAGFQAMGVKTKVVFLMRDPVERCWSAIRMHQGKTPAAGQSQQRLLRQRYALPETEIRTRYDRTIDVLENVFEPEALHFALFETLFVQREYDRLVDFLGFEANYDHLSNKQNARPKDEPISDELRKEIALHYADVYRFCADRFPTVKQVWANYDLAFQD